MYRKTSASYNYFRRAALGVAALVLIGLVGVSYHELRQRIRADKEVARTRQILDSVDTLLANLTVAEAGQRGFLLTGEDRYLESYNRAVRMIPKNLAELHSSLVSRAGESANVAQLDSLVEGRLAELRQTIELRRSESAQAALAVVLSDQGKRAMDQIRELGAEIRNNERTAQSHASAEGEAAAQTALLATVAGSLVLLFLFAFGLEPFASNDPKAKQRSGLSRYGAAVLAVVATVLLRMALSPLMGPTAMPFTLFFPAVWFAAWFGGFRPGALSVALSALAGDYFFASPAGSLRVIGRDDEVAMLMLVLVGFGMALLSYSQSRAVERAARAETAERTERQRFETTLESIGDAVIATDSEGRITFVNRVALSLLRAPEAAVTGKHLDEVFRIINEFTRAPVESPVTKVLREGGIVGLANHTVLIALDGAEIPIDDSGAPVRTEGGTIQGTVLVFRDITERRRAETAGHLLASIVESSDDAIVSKDTEGVITSWNKGAERIFGYSAEEAIGKPISMVAAPDRINEMAKILERIKRGERIDHFQTLRKTKNGDLVNISLTVSPVHNAAGRIVGASKIARDITAQVRAQRELAEQRERLHVTLGSIGDAVIAVDTLGLVSYLNPVAERLTGWTAAEGLGRPLEEIFRIVDEDSHQTAEDPVTRVLEEGKIAGLVNHPLLVSRAGNEIPIDDSAAPIRDARGELIGAVLVFRDITERRASEKLLASQAAQLRQTAELTDRAQLCVRDLNDRILYWSRGASELYGFPPEEAVGQISHSLFITEFPAPYDQIRAQLMAAGEWSGELVHTTRNGNRITVASRWALYRDAAARPVAILEVNTDITTRKRLEQELQETQRNLERIVHERTRALQLEIEERKTIELKLRESEQSLRQLSVRLISAQDEERRRIARELHDSVGQHLAYAKLNLDSFLEKPGTSEKGMETLSQVVDSLDKCLTETRTITHLLHPPLLDQLGFAFAARSFTDGFSQRSGIQVKLDIPGELKRLPSPVELVLFRVLQESLTNVLRHAQSQSVDIQLELKGDSVALAVKDYGKGIPSELLEKLRTTGEGGGVGLRGMRERISQFDGRFEIQSDDTGTLVRAVLPFSGQHSGLPFSAIRPGKVIN